MRTYKARYTETYSVDCTATVYADSEAEARQKVIENDVEDVDATVCWDSGSRVTEEQIYGVTEIPEEERP